MSVAVAGQDDLIWLHHQRPDCLMGYEYIWIYYHTSYTITVYKRKHLKSEKLLIVPLGKS